MQSLLLLYQKLLYQTHYVNPSLLKSLYLQQEDTEAVETLDETAEEADPFSTGEEDFTEGDEVAEAFSDSDQLTGEYQYVYAGLTWGEYWAAEGVYASGDASVAPSAGTSLLFSES